jgi:chemotaxis methyl-accepting protein methylase
MGTTDDVLRVAQAASGVDFSGYRPQTAERRIRARMTALGIDDLAHYGRLLRGSSDEVQFLIERLTIKVSRFYRNPPVFDALRSQVLPQLASLGRPVRIWSAGCGRGEEAYTLAMLLEDAALAGEVVATDVDRLALRSLRDGRYSAAAIADLPAAWVDRYLMRCGAAPDPYEVRTTVKSRVAVEHADLASPAGPDGASFDLICCRNVLIYWNAAAQRAILGHLLSRLQVGGWLCLGEAEWPVAKTLQLDVVAARLRLFRSRPMERLA